MTAAEFEAKWYGGECGAMQNNGEKCKNPAPFYACPNCRIPLCGRHVHYCERGRKCPHSHYAFKQDLATRKAEVSSEALR